MRLGFTLRSSYPASKLRSAIIACNSRTCFSPLFATTYELQSCVNPCAAQPYAKHPGVGVAPGRKIPKSNPCNSASNPRLRFLAALSLPPVRTRMRVRAVLAARAESMMATPWSVTVSARRRFPAPRASIPDYITDFSEPGRLLRPCAALGVGTQGRHRDIDRPPASNARWPTSFARRTAPLAPMPRSKPASTSSRPALPRSFPGQQVGLFSGPSYTIYKVLSALRLAEELRRAGKPAVAVFWLATEDHDLAEINHCLWPERGGFERLELPSEGQVKRRVGELPLGDGVSQRLVEQRRSGAPGSCRRATCRCSAGVLSAAGNLRLGIRKIAGAPLCRYWTDSPRSAFARAARPGGAAVSRGSRTTLRDRRRTAGAEQDA